MPEPKRDPRPSPWLDRLVESLPLIDKPFGETGKIETDEDLKIRKKIEKSPFVKWLNGEKSVQDAAISRVAYSLLNDTFVEDSLTNEYFDEHAIYTRSKPVYNRMIHSLCREILGDVNQNKGKKTRNTITNTQYEVVSSLFDTSVVEKILKEKKATNIEIEETFVKGAILYMALNLTNRVMQREENTPPTNNN